MSVRPGASKSKGTARGARHRPCFAFRKALYRYRPFLIGPGKPTRPSLMIAGAKDSLAPTDERPRPEGSRNQSPVRILLRGPLGVRTDVTFLDRVIVWWLQRTLGSRPNSHAECVDASLSAMETKFQRQVVAGLACWALSPMAGLRGTEDTTDRHSSWPAHTWPRVCVLSGSARARDASPPDLNRFAQACAHDILVLTRGLPRCDCLAPT